VERMNELHSEVIGGTLDASQTLQRFLGTVLTPPHGEAVVNPVLSVQLR